MLTIYSKTHCPYCVQAKNLLKLKKVEFNEINIEEDQDARSFLLSEGHRAVPQIYKDGKLFIEGGYQGLARLTDEELKERLGEQVWQS